MLKNEILTPSLETIGEEIGQELGAKMVKDFQDAYPAEMKTFLIGKNILEQILNQPGCVAIRFYGGLNELGQKTFVYVGVNEKDEIITEYPIINVEGKIEMNKGIVADRIGGNGKGSSTTTTTTSVNWSS
ncbi:hypothetical protein [Flavihumibacter profundi]|uniref:hypothetical protein n=1 Tax=Flavihumibacter profundi TaxID=2716883 RepID=UPI001CC5BF8A|nr:hypothetical protein [Flavihumibacter profundi]MBZ5857263.1 hypothetical protein [Flavihumibacter profundi]